MKRVVFSILFLTGLFSASAVYAHPGNTASDGCHYCRTNCSSWGEVYGSRHCHGGYSPSYSYPTYQRTVPYHETCSTQSLYDKYTYEKARGTELSNLNSKSWWIRCPLSVRQAAYRRVQDNFSGGISSKTATEHTQPPKPSWFKDQSWQPSPTINKTTTPEPTFRSDISAELNCMKISYAHWDYIEDDCFCNSGYEPDATGEKCVSKTDSQIYPSNGAKTPEADDNCKSYRNGVCQCFNGYTKKYVNGSNTCRKGK